MTDSGESRRTGAGGISEGASNLSHTNDSVVEASVSNITVEVAGSSSQTNSVNPTSPPPAPVESQNNSNNRGDGLFRFSLHGPRNFQPLTMIQEWARNSVSIPNLGSSSSSHNGETLSGIERTRLANMEQSDTQTQTVISLPNDAVTGNGSSSAPVLSFPSRLARGFFNPSNFRRRSDDGGQEPGYSNSTIPVGTASHRGRESLTLDIESRESSWDNSNVAGEEARSSQQHNGESPTRRTPGSGSATPNRTGPDGSPTAASTDILRDSPETRAFIEEINHYTTLRPFLVLMLIKSLVDHGSGIVCFMALIVTFSHANSLLKKEVSKQRKRNLLFLAMIVLNLIGCAAFIYYVFSDEELYYSLAFMNTKVDLNTFWMLMWVVGVTDYIAKFAAIVAKACIVAVPTIFIPFQKRGIYYLFIEQTSQLYRSVLPIHHWLLYLVGSYEGNMKMFGLILAGLYALFKMVDSVQRVKDWNSAFQKLFQNVHYGTTLTPKELDSMDSVICPICHDTFTAPTRLSCSHIFCEECVSTWFDRERTCPMCRAKVVDDPQFRDGTTAQYIQFF